MGKSHSTRPMVRPPALSSTRLSRVEGPETQTQGRPLMRLMQAERVDFVLQAGVDS